MKKWIAVIAAVLLSALFFTACSSDYYVVGEVDVETPTGSPEAVEDQVQE